ncbi:MAG: hypothetical protein ACOYMN_18650 [Roseimicrobium sp.]
MPTCLVCGFADLHEPPRAPSGGGSYEICPSCGFQFGVDDDDKGISHEQWRARWVEKGTPWSSRGLAQPQGWDPLAQMAAVTPPAKKRTPSAKKAVRKKS